MFKIIGSLLLLLLSNTAFGQYSSEGDLISRFRPGSMWFYTGIRPAQVEKVRKYDRLVFDLTYNSLNGDQKPFKAKFPSLGLTTNLMFDIPLTKGNTVSIGTGFYHTLFRINQNNYPLVDSLKTFTTLYPTDSLNNIHKSIFGGNSIGLPLELRFRLKSWRHVKLHLGGRIGYQLNSFGKLVTNGTDGKEIYKNYNLPDVNRLVYSAHARVGLRNWAIYASYNFNPMFSNVKSSKVNLLQVGISVSLF